MATRPAHSEIVNPGAYHSAVSERIKAAAKAKRGRVWLAEGDNRAELVARLEAGGGGDGMKFRWINRYDPGRRLIRLCSVLWWKEAGDPGHRRRLSVSLHPVLFRFHHEYGGREYGAWSLTVLGLRLHYKSRPHGVLV